MPETSDASLAFPPLLKGFRAAGQKSYPGHRDRKKALAPRPLRVNPN